jgi:negative regulator of flagellin synthesis FlgM
VEINDSLKKTSGLQARTQTPTGRAGAAEQPTIAATGPGADSVTISQGAQALAAAGGSGAVFDTSKVEEIKAAMASGTFKVDPEKVAQGLMDSVRDLLSARR